MVFLVGLSLQMGKPLRDLLPRLRGRDLALYRAAYAVRPWGMADLMLHGMANRESDKPGAITDDNGRKLRPMAPAELEAMLRARFGDRIKEANGGH